MKKALASAAAALLFTIPLFASADTFSDVQIQMRNLLAGIAALTGDRSLSCFITTSKKSVTVGEKFLLLWGSMGAGDAASTQSSGWAPFGAYWIMVDQPGNRIYQVTVNDAHGQHASCETRVTVLRKS